MSQMPVHGGLIQAEQEVPLIAVVEHLLVADTHSQEDMPAPDNGLVGVIRIEVQAAADKDAGENIARGCDPLARSTPNS
jgi:hypothetical protein